MQNYDAQFSRFIILGTVGWQGGEVDIQLNALYQNWDGKVTGQVIPDDNLGPLSLVSQLFDEDGVKGIAEGLLINPAILCHSAPLGACFG